jgi:hypothetical protein
MRRSPDEFRLTLLENGLDFIANGLQQLADDNNSTAVKYAVLHLAGGIELVFKERLRLCDWRLLFTNPEKADERKFQSGDFFSCGWEVCLDRLREHEAIEIDKRAVLRLNALFHQRNRLQHFRLADSREALKSLVIRAMNVVLDFIGDYFELEELEPQENALLEEIRGRIRQLEAFRAHRRKELQARPADNETRIECPVCGEAFLHPDWTVRCEFCFYTATCEDAAVRYAEDVLGLSAHYCAKEGIDYPVHECRYCENQSMVVDEEGVAVCFSCGAESTGDDIRVCPLCGRAADPDGFVGDQCFDCFRDYVQQDHT